MVGPRTSCGYATPLEFLSLIFVPILMKFCLTLILLSIAHLLYAQTERCYDQLVLDGRVALEATNYTTAIDKFKAALECPDLSAVERTNLAVRLEEATTGYLQQLDEARKKALEARDLAEKSRQTTRKQLEEVLDETKILKATLETTRMERDEATKLARETEASRLMLLAKSRKASPCG